MAEAAFLAEQGGGGARATVAAPPAKKPAAQEDEEEKAISKTPLPELDDLMKRLPTETRELIDELFRAKFTKVTRVPKQALKG